MPCQHCQKYQLKMLQPKSSTFPKQTMGFKMNNSLLQSLPDSTRVVKIKKLCRSRSGFINIGKKAENMTYSSRTIKIKDLLDGFMYSRCQEWGTLFPEATGTCQSPVNLVSQDAVYDSELEKNSLRFNYNICRETDILNNGHTLAVFPRVKHVLAGGPLPPNAEYELTEIRFHWGRDNKRGSEHTVNGKAFPMEVQLVHWNSTKYSSIEEALGSQHGIAIVSLFTQLGREHTGLRVITDNLEDVLYKGRQKTATSAFNPNCLLPDPLLRDYWAYEGSVTSPPCSEKVQWILLRYPLMLSYAQIEEFRRLRTFSKGDASKSGDGAMIDNFRPTQPLGDRKIRASFQY